ncbi:MAG: hypothetical protein ABS897_03765 [Eubacteriales bacterium]
MMMWTMYEPKTLKRRKASMGIKTENPLDHIKACVSQCRAQGMAFQETVETVKSKFNYFPTEAEIVVKDFWS